MPAPFFTTNDSDIPQLEGLYVKERLPPATVSGANLSKVCIVGETVRGPVGVAVDISSEARFQEVFGYSNRNNDAGAITNKVWQALLNKPFGALAVVRVAAAAAVKATHTLASVTPTDIVRVDASSAGAWGLDITGDVEDASDAVANHFNLVIHYQGKDFLYENLDLTTGNDNTALVLGDDYANVITLTKLASGRPINVTGFTMASGADGTVADSDYTGASKGLEVAAAAKSCGVVFVAEYMTAAIKTKVASLVASVNDRVFVVGPDASTTSAATAITDVASHRSDRIIYAFNHPYTLDPRTASEIVTQPTSWVASLLSQTDVDINIGEADSKQFTGGISKLYHEEYLRADYIALKAAGICAFEKDDGFGVVSACTTSLVSGKDQIDRRRSADYLQLSAAAALKYSVKKKNTVSRRLANAAMLNSFLGDLERNERIVESFSVDTEKLNTPTQRAQGIEKILMRVRLIGHILELVLETEIGTSVVIAEK